MRFLMAWEIKMSPSGLSEVLVVHITKVLTESLFQGVFGFTHILIISLFAVNKVYKILGLTVIFFCHWCNCDSVGGFH